jgi:hypothetical protein
MLTEFWHRFRARQRRILSEAGQIELAVERENPRKSPRNNPRFTKQACQSSYRLRRHHYYSYRN